MTRKRQRAIDFVVVTAVIHNNNEWRECMMSEMVVFVEHNAV